MPRKSPSRLELRKQAEAAERSGVSPKAKATKKKATKKRATRKTKQEVLERKRLVWVIYTATLREEARFPYDQRKEAEEKLESLLSKGKRTYFLQPVKESLSGGPAKIAADIEDDDVNEDDVVVMDEEAEVDDADFDDDDDSDGDVDEADLSDDDD